MSFSKLLRSTEELWAAFRYLEGTLTSTLRDQMWKKYLDDVRRWAVLPERRSRSCPRVLRQPVSKWSRKIDQPSHTGKVTIKLVRV
jgi:hypothetical protein